MSIKNRQQILKDAWVGTPCCVYARHNILIKTGVVDDATCARMTSNRFLTAIGEPSEVEAQIGRVFQATGLAAAFSWIEQNLVPRFERQEANRRRRARPAHQSRL